VLVVEKSVCDAGEIANPGGLVKDEIYAEKEILEEVDFVLG